MRPLTIDNIKNDNYTPETRNKIIAGMFNNPEITDKRGTGFLSIREDLEKWELPPPEFEERMDWFVIRFRNPYVERVIDTDKLELNERQKKAVIFISEHKTIKRKEYAELCKCSIATAQRDLDELVSKDIVKRVGKMGRWVYYELKEVNDSFNDSFNDSSKMQSSEKDTKT